MTKTMIKPTLKLIEKKEKKPRIFYDSWGYEQSNVDFYQVVRESEKSLWLRKISDKRVEEAFMSGIAYPLENEFIGEVFRVRKPDQNGYIWTGLVPGRCLKEYTSEKGIYWSSYY